MLTREGKILEIYQLSVSFSSMFRYLSENCHFLDIFENICYVVKSHCNVPYARMCARIFVATFVAVKQNKCISVQG